MIATDRESRTDLGIKVLKDSDDNISDVMEFVVLRFLGAFAKLRKETVSFVMSFLPAAWNNSAPTPTIFMKFEIRAFFEKLSRKIQVSLKSGKNNGYFT